MNSIEYEDAIAAADLAQAAFDIAAANFDTKISNIVPHDEFSYAGVSPSDLQQRQSALAEIDATTLTEEKAEALAAEIAAVDAAMSDEATAQYAMAETDLEAARKESEQAGTLVTDDALTEALLAAANKNRVAEYGVDSYVDEEMLDWAKEVLGVDDAYGKIDEIREYQSTIEPDADEPELEEVAEMTLRSGL